MAKRITSIVFSIVLLFSLLVSSSGGFDNDANFKDPQNRELGQRDYTRENSTKSIEQGGYYGGHDTITAEGMLLKQEVHKGDPDGGEKFNKWVEDNKVLPSLRTGAHDEDTNKWLNFWLNDPAIGPNGWGNFFYHFLDPSKVYKTEEYGYYDIGAGLLGSFPPSTRRAKDYTKEIKKLLCKTQKAPLTDEEKKKLYDYFGRILHLLEDMGNPAHTQDDLHVITKTLEDYVRDNWANIVNSDGYKNSVNPEEYGKGNYEGDSIWNPENYIDTLARESMRYPTDGLGWITQEQAAANAMALIPLTVKMVGGYIDQVYKGGQEARGQT